MNVQPPQRLAARKARWCPPTRDLGAIVLNLLLKVTWASVVVLGLWLMFQGLWAKHLLRAHRRCHRRGTRRPALLVASVALSLAALASFTLLRQPKAVGFALMTPVVVCGGLLLTVPETLFPQIAVAVAYPIALGGLCWGTRLVRPAALRGLASDRERHSGAKPRPSHGDDNRGSWTGVPWPTAGWWVTHRLAGIVRLAAPLVFTKIGPPSGNVPRTGPRPWNQPPTLTG